MVCIKMLGLRPSILASRKMVLRSSPKMPLQFHKSKSGWLKASRKTMSPIRLRDVHSLSILGMHIDALSISACECFNVYFTNLNRETSHANERSRWPDSPLLKFAFFYGKANLFKPPCNYGTGQNALRH